MVFYNKEEMKVSKDIGVKVSKTHYKDSKGLEYWKECNVQGLEVHRKYSNGLEYWKEYNNNGLMNKG